MLGLFAPLSWFSAVLGPGRRGVGGRAGKTLTYFLGRSDPQVLCVPHSRAGGGGEVGKVRVREYSGNPGRKEKSNPDPYLSLYRIMN